MIDWDRLNALRDDIGEEDFADVAFLFVSEIGEKLATLQADPAVAGANDFHFLRGSAVNLGLTEFAEQCTAAEIACKTGQRPDIDGVAGAFHAALATLSPDLPAITSAA